MIICLKNADFSASNLGKVYFKDVNLNIDEGTNNPMMFKYNNAIGSGEFLGVDFITKENPSPFSIVRKLHKGGTGAYLYSVQYNELTTLDFPRTPDNISMAIWINKNSWESISHNGNIIINIASRNVSNSGWLSTGSEGGDNRVDSIYYSKLANENEEDSPLVGGAISGRVKRKVLDTKVVNGETWVCVGMVFYNLTFNSELILENSVPRILFNCLFMLNDSEHYLEIGNLQVVDTPNYLVPDKDYSL